MLTARDRLGNELADRLAKQAVQQHRVPRSIREAVPRQEREVEEMAWWVGRVTLAANSWGPQSLRDSESSRNAAYRHGCFRGRPMGYRIPRAVQLPRARCRLPGPVLAPWLLGQPSYFKKKESTIAWVTPLIN